MTLGIFALGSCAEDETPDPRDPQGVESSGANTASGDSAGASGGRSSSSESGSGIIDLGGAKGSCEVRRAPLECAAREDDSIEEKCFSLQELSDPCAGTHLWSVHLGEGGGAGVDRGPEAMGDGGSEDCPSAEALFWGDVGDRCGCFDVPACTTPTIQRGSLCCYRVQTSCRLC